jgi:hypothetical protein
MNKSNLLMKKLEQNNTIQNLSDVALQLVQLDDKNNLLRLMNLLQSANASSQQRYWVAYVLSHSPCFYNDKLKVFFLNFIKSKKCPIKVLAQIIEGLTYTCLYKSKQSKIYNEIFRNLKPLLESKSPVIRFWTIFFFGSMKEKRVLKELSEIAKNDKAVCPGFWAVKLEAQDAIEVIHGGVWPDRKSSGK